MPKVTVVVPAYNAEQTIIATIASVQQQTYQDWELIVIDDGSSDRTLELLNRIREPRLQVYHYSNAGVSVARNRGLAHAQGELIAFLDADDLWSANKLELQVAALQQHPHAAVAYSWTYFMNATATTIHAAPSVWFEGDVYPQLLVRNFLYSGSNPLVRRDALVLVGGFDPTLTHGEDWELFARLAAVVQFVVVPVAQVFYRQSATSASAQVELMEQRILQVIDSVFSCASPQFHHFKNESLANFYQYLTGIRLAQATSVEDVKQAGQKLQMAVRLSPKILLNKTTQLYLAKMFLMKLFSPGITKKNSQLSTAYLTQFKFKQV
ncbi:glycosyltransferase family 2 protein [Gloeocapsopsis dulcis]|uniref:Glycosyl transferase family A n=1 Tax=Gloeocapsopsis dulcis AAB1 = 1H9 TaxID=1433147 RepID=A0A6N8FU43_9CHRO|nr:glycosyltransferase family A protein [Gloeocapsopsis dulcis]MUL36284.1 glycosyl transferase family A [Gloeocapsopsis dulcis AAB1 = 1H9]WNN89605.1 glycosyltransferase family A protein [Gloeocapsopsis dulcis]